MHTVRIDNAPKQCAELLWGLNIIICIMEKIKVGPDSRHVPYFIIHCQ